MIWKTKRQLQHSPQPKTPNDIRWPPSDNISKSLNQAILFLKKLPQSSSAATKNCKSHLCQKKNRNSRQYERFPHVNSQISALRIAPVKQKRNSYVYEAYFIPCKEASEGNTVEDACFVSVAEAAPDTQTSLWYTWKKHSQPEVQERNNFTITHSRGWGHDSTTEAFQKGQNPENTRIIPSEDKEQKDNTYPRRKNGDHKTSLSKWLVAGLMLLVFEGCLPKIKRLVAKSDEIHQRTYIHINKIP